MGAEIAESPRRICSLYEVPLWPLSCGVSVYMPWARTIVGKVTLPSVGPAGGDSFRPSEQCASAALVPS